MTAVEGIYRKENTSVPNNPMGDKSFLEINFEEILKGVSIFPRFILGWRRDRRRSRPWRC